MTREPAAMLRSLEGRAFEIAATVARTVKAEAPYAELGLALGVPTWFFHDRVLSLLPLPGRCQLHFWQGEQLALRHPGKLQRPSRAPVAYLALTSMLEVDDGVRGIIRDAFALKIEEFAA